MESCKTLEQNLPFLITLLDYLGFEMLIGCLFFFPFSLRAINKKERFAAEPMGYKTVKKLPGIGRAIGKRLNDDGIFRAKQVKEKVGHEGPAYLQRYGANARHRRNVDDALKNQDENYME